MLIITTLDSYDCYNEISIRYQIPIQPNTNQFDHQLPTGSMVVFLSCSKISFSHNTISSHQLLFLSFKNQVPQHFHLALFQNSRNRHRNERKRRPVPGRREEQNAEEQTAVQCSTGAVHQDVSTS